MPSILLQKVQAWLLLFSEQSRGRALKVLTTQYIEFNLISLFYHLSYLPEISPRLELCFNFCSENACLLLEWGRFRCLAMQC